MTKISCSIVSSLKQGDFMIRGIKLCFIIIVLLVSIPAYSQTTQTELVESNYETSQILNQMFPSSFWWEGESEQKWAGFYQKNLLESGVEKSDFNFSKRTVVKLYPWFSEYMLNDAPNIHADVLHRWERGVSIGIGWPATIRNGKSYSINSPETSVPYFKNVESVLDKFVPVLQESTGLKISVLNPNDPQEATEDHARIRIVPDKAWPKRSTIPAQRYAPNIYDYERYLWTALPLSTSDNSLLDGYALLNKDNSLAFAVCKVSTTLSESSFERAVQKCLIGAFGIASKNTDIARSVERSDLNALKALYCPALKSGMNKFEVLNKFTASDDCLKKLN